MMTLLLKGMYGNDDFSELDVFPGEVSVNDIGHVLAKVA
jgi:hypothetical protein